MDGAAGDQRGARADAKPLVADAVSKVYNEDSPLKDPVTAVDEASFAVEENEFAVLIGPSGCGKTTMLHLFAGLVEPSSGSLRASGEPISGTSTDRAVVFQHFNLFPWRTVRGNVAFGLEMTGHPEAERDEVAEEFIDLVGLSGFGDSYPSELSGGMQQRVGLARALAVDPEVLLMDEPFGALDAQTRQRMQQELLRIWEQDRKTILFVTHDIDEAIILGDRVLVMGAGSHDIIAELAVPFERPRSGREIETTRQFQELKRDLWETLEGQTDAGG